MTLYLNQNIDLIEGMSGLERKDELRELTSVLRAISQGQPTSNCYVRLCEIARGLNLSVDKLLSSRLSANEIRSHLQDLEALPFYYQTKIEKMTSRAGMINVYDFLSKFMKLDDFHFILRRLGLPCSLEAFNKSDYVSSRIPFDLFEELARFGFDLSFFRAMGENTFELMPIHAKLALKRESKIQNRLEKLIQEIIPSSYDRFFDYSVLKVRSEFIDLRIEVKPEAKELFKGKAPFHKELAHYIAGAFLGALRAEDRPYLTLETLGFSTGQGQKIRLKSLSPLQ